MDIVNCFMPTITDLQITKKQDQVNLYLDDNYIFSIPVDLILNNKVKVNNTLTIDEISQLFIDALTMQLFQKSVEYIYRRKRSTLEIKQYIQKRIFTKFQTLQKKSKYKEIIEQIKFDKESLINQTITKLTEKKYLNDEEFALAWTNSRINKDKGINKIKYELIQKGISSTIIQSVFAKLNTKIQDNTQESISKIINKALPILLTKNLPKFKIKQRLLNRLISRGFTYQQVKSQIDEQLSTEYNDVKFS